LALGSTRETSGIRRFATIVGKAIAVLIAFVAVMLASGYFSMRVALKGRRVTVPEVTGLTLLEAEEVLARMDLLLDVAVEKYDDRLEEGRILAQDPTAGAAIKKYRKVKVVKSLGAKVFRIPDLSGSLLRSALIKLEAEGLSSGRVVYAHTRIAQTDEVVSQDPPPAGETLGHGGVSLLVSKGPREAVFVMPRLTGRRLAEITPLVEAGGLRLGRVRREPHAWLPRGTISSQFPLAGYPVAAGNPISLVVSN
jgi:serine/threonine-protein kinase